MRTQIAADLLQSGELRFDQVGVAGPSTTGSHRAAHGHSHPAMPAGIRRQLATSGLLLARTDYTFEKLRRDGGIRTRGLLLPSQLPPIAACSPASPGMALTCDNNRLTWPRAAH